MVLYIKVVLSIFIPKKKLFSMKKIAKIFLLIGTLSFATLSISTPLLHNHQIDFSDHYNCPAFILSATFVSMVFIFIAKTLIEFPKQNFKVIPEKVAFISTRKEQSISNRAPPFKNF